MEFNISTESIQRAIKVLSVVVRDNATDTSGRILIDASDNNVSFMSNNGTTAITFDATNVEVEDPGVVSITYGKIKSFISALKPWDGTTGAKILNFKTTDRNTEITVNNVYSNGKSVKGELKLSNTNPALMATPPEFGEANFTLNSTIFRTATNKVMYAINPQVDFNQPALQGMNIQFEPDSIFFAGSDGVVLSEYQVKNVSERVEGNVTLQYDFIMGLRRLISDDIQLLWEVKGNRVSVKFDDIIYIGRRIIGHEFPDYKPTLDRFTDYLSLEKEFLIGSLQTFADVLDPEDNYRLTFEIKDKTLRIFNDYAKVETEQDIAGGLDFSIDLNGKQMLQTIEAIKDDFILFKFSDSEGFAIFDSSTFNDQKALISSIRQR